MEPVDATLFCVLYQFMSQTPSIVVVVVVVEKIDGERPTCFTGVVHNRVREGLRSPIGLTGGRIQTRSDGQLEGSIQECIAPNA
jgi:hypothetical protein